MRNISISIVGVISILCIFSMNSFATVYKLETGVITGIEPQNLTGNWNVIYNGGGELGATTGWSVFPGWMASLSLDTFHKIAGNYSFKMHMKVNNPNWRWGAAASNYASVSSGKYVISGFFYKDYSITGGMYLDLNDLAVYDTSNNSVSDNIMVDRVAAGWQFIYGVFDFDGPRTLHIRVVRDSAFSAGEDFYFDDIAVTPLSEFHAPLHPSNSVVPEPVSGGLFLLGLAGIIFKKK